jgi:hypothetical protein
VLHPAIFTIAAVSILAVIKFGGDAAIEGLKTSSGQPPQLPSMIQVFLLVAGAAVFLGLLPRILRTHGIHRQRYGTTHYCNSCGSHFKG